jgi:hypothetical protein
MIDMEKTLFALLGGMLLLLCSVAFAIPSDLQVSVTAPAGFGDGEMVYFDYSILPPAGGRVSFMPSIVCEGNIVAPIREETVSLIAGEAHSARYSDFAVGERTKPGNCVGSVVVTENGEPTDIRASTTFTINTLPVLETRFMTCADEACEYPKKVFTQSQTVYIRGTTKSGEPISVQSGDAQFTDGRAIMSMGQPGYHSVSVISSNPAYKNTPAGKVQYAVIESHPRIRLKNFNVLEKPPIKEIIPSTGNRIVK